MTNYTKRYIELFEARNEPVVIENNCIYKAYQRIAVPVGPAAQDFSLTHDSAKLIMQKLKTPIVRCTSGFNDIITQGWYAVICNTYRSIESLKSKDRNAINRGLKNCIVQKKDAEFLSDFGHEVYVATHKNYTRSSLFNIDKESYKQNILVSKNFEDIHHHWCVFNQEKKLIGYCQVYVYDKTEANFSVVKLHPEFNHLYTSYALFHTMLEYYLNTMKFQYVNGGYRSIKHDTNFQDYLIRKFAFEKKHIGMQLYYNPMLKAAINIALPFRKLVSVFTPKYDSLLQQEYIRRHQK